jgi:sugar phosphate isomerase/epimerase
MKKIIRIAQEPASSPTTTRRDFLRATTVLGVAGLTRPLDILAAGAPKYQLGCYTRPWDQFEYRVALDGIAEAGFKYAGLMTAKGNSSAMIRADVTAQEVATLAEEVKKRGLKTLSIYSNDFPVAQSVEAGIDGLRKLIDYCVICGCPNLLLGGTTDQNLFRRYYTIVAECCDYASSKAVGLTIKPHGGQNATGTQCRKIIEQIARPNFRLWYDPGNIFYYSDGKLDPVDDSTTVDGLVVGMSVKDFRPPKEVLVTPGTGQVKFREVIAHLQKGGFKGGPLIVECVAHLDQPSQITAEAKKALSFLKELTGQPV